MAVFEPRKCGFGAQQRGSRLDLQECRIGDLTGTIAVGWGTTSHCGHCTKAATPLFENCPSLLIGHTPNGIEIRVDFTEDLAKTPGAVKAWHIRTVQSIGFTSTDRAVFFDAVKEKYGRPPYAKLTSGNESLGYCDKLGPNEACEFNDYRLQSGLSRINRAYPVDTHTH
jgi:hypothetical protein